MPDEPFDYCAGGHPPGSTWDDDGTTADGIAYRVTRCRRCGRALDLTMCPHGLAKAFCGECWNA